MNFEGGSNPQLGLFASLLWLVWRGGTEALFTPNVLATSCYYGPGKLSARFGLRLNDANF
ncbi:hypothetical protein E2C01_009656 [Portunus trituberculatus]|uniref:Uncharacterized protein n=1 Tax=Portunus trituberculatus TaxID=210409 RepID=A0A5B7D6C5_PORTR|nr:hypothetical protein [Portunus trituberculatus]